MTTGAEHLDREGAADKTNPIVGAARTVWVGTMWGLAEGLDGGNRLEQQATAACSPALPGVTVCSLLLPRENAQLARQSHGGVPTARPSAPAAVSVTPEQRLAVALLPRGMRARRAARSVGGRRHPARR